MSLYWPDQGVAVDIVDDPASQPFDRESNPDVRVLELTCDQIRDPEAFDDFAETLAFALGEEPPERTDEWVERNRRLRQTLFGADEPDLI